MTTTTKTVAAAVIGLALATLGCSAKGEGRDRQSAKPAVAVEVTPATATALDLAIEVVGTLEPKFFADVKSEFTAVVEDVYVTQWVRVEKGTPLAKLDTREADATFQGAKAATLQAEVNATRAARELDRAVKLKESGLLTQQSLDDARSANEASSGGRAGGRRPTRGRPDAPREGGDPIADGGDRRLACGQRRRPRREHGRGEPMFRVVDNRVLELTVPVPSARSAPVKVGEALAFAVDAYPGKAFSGRVMYINPAADPTSRAVRVIADVPNPDGEAAWRHVRRGADRDRRARGRLGDPAGRVARPGTSNAAQARFSSPSATRRSAVWSSPARRPRSSSRRQGARRGDRVITRGGFNIRPGDRVQVASPQGA